MLKPSEKSWSSLRSPALMGGGTVLVGASGYAFVALAGHTLSTAAAAAISSFYLLVNIIGPGLFIALEQETNRATSSTLAAGGDLKPVFRRAFVHAVSLLGAVAATLALISPILVGRVLLGHWELFFAVVLSAVTAASIYLVRGALGGMSRFTGYSATLAGEGLVRLMPALGLAALGLTVPGLYGLVFALGSAAGAIAGLYWLRTGRATTEQARSADDSADDDSKDAPDLGTARGLVFLVGATLLAQAVANLAPIVVTARMVADTATAAAFASAFILARIPLFVFSPAQALVLPSVSAAVSQGDQAKVRRLLRWVLLIAAAIGVVGTVLAAAIGPWAVQTFFGAKVALAHSVLGLLGFSTMLLMAAQILQAVLVAYRAHHAATASWVVSTVLLSLLLTLPIAPIQAAVIAQTTASTAVVLGMLMALFPKLRSTAATNVSRTNAREG